MEDLEAIAPASLSETSQLVDLVLRAVAAAAVVAVRGSSAKMEQLGRALHGVDQEAVRAAMADVDQLERDLALFSREETCAGPSTDVVGAVEAALRVSSGVLDVRREYGARPVVAVPAPRLAEGLLLLLLARGSVRHGDVRPAVVVTVTEENKTAVLDARFHASPPLDEAREALWNEGRRRLEALGANIVCAPDALRASLPLPPPASSGDVQQGAAPRGRILAVDDEGSILGSMKRILGRAYDVTLHTRASEALDRLKHGERYDLVLCDLNMPEMSGMEFYQQVVRCAPACVERIVFVTGGGFTPAERAFFDSIPNERYAKPIEVKTLRALAKRFVAPPK